MTFYQPSGMKLLSVSVGSSSNLISLDWHLLKLRALMFLNSTNNKTQTPGGGYLTRFWTGTCHRGFKNIPVPYTNFSKMYTRLYTNFSKTYTRLYTKFPKVHTRPYTNFENCENRYRSLYQNRENRYPSRWHVPVPKICIVPPPPPGLKHEILHVLFTRPDLQFSFEILLSTFCMQNFSSN